MYYSSLLTYFASESAEKAEGIAALGIDQRAFIIQFVTWILVFVVLAKFVFRPIVNMLQKRQDTIDEGIRLTTEMTQQKDKAEAEFDKVMSKARKEANEMISKANDQASTIIKEAEETAQEKAEKIMVDAKSRIDDETLKARRKLEKEMLDLVVEATEIVVDEKIDARKDSGLIAKALKGKA